MLSKALDQITLDDLQGLVGHVREGKTLEYKRELPGGKAGSMKVLAGVTALANTSGGDFVIGVAEKDGVAESVPGIPVEDVDRYKQTLDQILADYVEPRLPRVDIHQVQCGEGRWVFVIRTSRSWLGPHRVTSDNNFYVRTSTATVPLDVADLRTAFSLRDGGVERIENFRRERLARIIAGQTPVRVFDGPTMVLHMAPLPSFVNRDLIDIVEAVEKGSHMPLPLRGQGRYVRSNLLGIYNFPGDDGQGSTGYGQLFRSGAYEGVCAASAHDGERYVGSIDLANAVVGGVRNYLSLQAHYGFDFPTFAMFSFCDAADLVMRSPAADVGGGAYYNSNALGEEVVAFPEFVLEDAKADVPKALRPLLNIVWNAFGLGRCDMYNADGGWKGL